MVFSSCHYLRSNLNILCCLCWCRLDTQRKLQTFGQKQQKRRIYRQTVLQKLPLQASQHPISCSVVVRRPSLKRTSYWINTSSCISDPRQQWLELNKPSEGGGHCVGTGGGHIRSSLWYMSPFSNRFAIWGDLCIGVQHFQFQLWFPTFPYGCKYDSKSSHCIHLRAQIVARNLHRRSHWWATY